MKNKDILESIPSQRSLLMFPVRLETRFKGNKLLVRIFPDEILLENNTTALRPEEMKAGKRFWIQWFIASGDKKREYAAWETLCSAYSLDDAVRISSVSRPPELDRYRIGGDRFHLRPYAYLDASGHVIDIPEACNEIYSQLGLVKNISPESDSWVMDEYVLTQTLLRITSILDSISFVFNYSSYVVDYLFDSVSACLTYLAGRLDSISRFYEKNPAFKDNPSAFEFQDSDYTALLKLKDRVAGFLGETKDRVMGLDAMTQMYLEKFDSVFFGMIPQYDLEHPSAPFAFLLPDRFVMVTETYPDQNGKTARYRVEGQEVMGNLPVGLDFQGGDTSGFSVDDEGNLSVSGKLRWMVDFEAARSAGMALSLDLPEGCRGVQYIYVYGIRTPLKAPYTNGPLLEGLFKSHRFYNGGVSLVKTGTPTNLIDGCREEKALSDEELMRLRYELEIEDAGDRAPANSDGRVLAEVLGIPFKNGMNRALHLENTEISDERKAELCLWGKFFVSRMMEGRQTLPAYKYMLNHLASFIVSYMNPRGIAPVFRIDDRPYGIIPVTDFEHIHFPVTSTETVYYRLFLDMALAIARRWERMLDRVPGPETMKGQDAERMFIDMIAQTPRSVSYKEQIYTDSPFTPSEPVQESVLKHLERMGLLKGRPVEGDLDEVRSFSVKEYVDELKKAIPSIEDWQAERLFSDFIDQFTFRIDPWLTAFTQYMRTINKDTAARETPVFGAYGWVFNLERNTRPSADKGEYILAPSLQHALTAAVLRNAYLTSKSGKTDSHLCINLSSMRARQALRMLDGIKQGMSTGIILGADLERYLHEARKPEEFGVEMDEFIYPLRKLFPQSVNLEAEDGRAEDYRMSIINGEALLNSFMGEWDRTQVLWKWLAGKSSSLEWFKYLRKESGMGTKAVETLCKLIERIQDSYDALNDLLLAEGVHRLVAGDKASFAAISAFMSEGRGNLPSPAVLDTSSEYVVVSHKAAMALPTATAPDSARILTLADPGVAGWFDSFFGHHANYSFSVILESDRKYQFQSDLERVDIDAAEYIYLSSNLQVLKNVLEFRWRQATGHYEGKVRILTGDPAELEPGESGPASFDIAIPLFEASLMVDDVRNLLSYGRALRPGDIVPDIESDAEEEAAVDVEDLRGRYEAILDRVSQVTGEMEDLVHRAQEAGRMEDEVVLRLYGLLDTCASAGMFNLSRSFDSSLLLSHYHPVADSQGYARAIGKQGKFLADILGCIGTLREKMAEARGIVGDGNPVSASRYVEAIQALTMKSVKVFPRFRIDSLGKEEPDPNRIANQLASYQYFLNLRDGFDMDAWLSDVAEVRTGMKYLLNYWQLSFLRYGSGVGRISILQPTTSRQKQLYKDRDSRANAYSEWLGAPVSSEDILDDADSLMLFRAEYAGEGGWYCGFVFDSWLEYIPYRKKTAGMVFRCDQPDAEAPQALLLALHPECNTKAAASGKWDLGTMETILSSTARLARIRTVSPDVIDAHEASGPLGSLLSYRLADEAATDILRPDGNCTKEELKELVRKAKEDGILTFDSNGTIPTGLFHALQ